MTEQTLYDITLTVTDTALLTAEQEKELSRLIQAGTEAGKRLESGCPSFTEEERAELERTDYDGRLAYEHLVTANQRLACKLANEAARKNPGGIDEVRDYEQTAFIALCECARTFDWRYGVRFSTYAYQRVKQALIRENAQTAYAVRVPEDLLYKVNSMRALLATQTADEAAREMGMTVDQLFKLKAATTSGASLNAPLNSDELECELGDLIADETALTGQEIEELLFEEEDMEWLYEWLEKLSEREHDLICKRFGLCGEEPHKLAELTGVTAKTAGGVQKQISAILRRLRENYIDRLPLAA